MNFNSLQAGQKRKKPQRIGRGGKRGTTSGRGQKGQKSRSGRKLRPAVRDLIIRISKRRGFRNKPKSDKPLALSLRDLSRQAMILGKGAKIDRLVLAELGVIPANYKGRIRILASGSIKLAVDVRELEVTKGAAAAIIKAGGTVKNTSGQE